MYFVNSLSQYCVMYGDNFITEDKTVDSKNPELIKVDDKHITFISVDEAIKIIYDTYYEYDDEQIEE